MNRARVIRIGLLSGLAVVLIFGIKHTRHYVIPKRFAVVEAGNLYRGGWQKPYPLRQIIQTRKIRTVLNLACDPNELDGDGEGTIVRENRLQWVKILMPGTGLGTYDQLDHAADTLNAVENRPVFFHCAAGIHRTNMALAAYRLKHCGWTLSEVVTELQPYKFTPERRPDQYRHLQGYIEHLKQQSNPSLTARIVGRNRE